MKTLKYFGMMMLTVMMAFSMASCGSDKNNDDDEGGGGENGGSTTSVVGTWYQDVTDDYQGWLDEAYEIITFKENGTYIEQELYYTYGQWVKSTNETGSYKIDGNKITANGVTKTWSRSGSDLILNGETWHKITSSLQKNLNNAISGDDYE